MPLSNRYYLLENRPPIGYDRNSSDRGMLPLDAEDAVAERRRGKSPLKLVDGDYFIFEGNMIVLPGTMNAPLPR